MKLSGRTVENHVFNALARLCLHNRVRLATWVTGRSPSEVEGQPRGAWRHAAHARRHGAVGLSRAG